MARLNPMLTSIIASRNVRKASSSARVEMEGFWVSLVRRVCDFGFGGGVRRGSAIASSGVVEKDLGLRFARQPTIVWVRKRRRMNMPRTWWALLKYLL